MPWYYRYAFTIRTGMTFSNGDPATPGDIEYSFERALVMEAVGGPQWMFYEPLLNTLGAEYLGDIGNSTDPGPDVALVGKMIDHAVESNSTHVWFNLAFPGAYAPFMKTLCQTWSSILSKSWTTAFAGSWSGDWMLNGDHTDWITYRGAETSPLDLAGYTMMGSGPFILETLDFTNSFWSANRNAAYWRGWPINWPSTSSSPKGYVNHFVCDFGKLWSERKALFLAGDVHYVAVPRGVHQRNARSSRC